MEGRKLDDARMTDGARQVLLPMSRQQMSGAVKAAMECIGFDPQHYCGKSMRRGGIGAGKNSGSNTVSAERSRDSHRGTTICGPCRSSGAVRDWKSNFVKFLDSDMIGLAGWKRAASMAH